MQIFPAVPFVKSELQWSDVEWNTAIDGHRRRSSRLLELSEDGLRAHDANYGNKRKCVLYDRAGGRLTARQDKEGRERIIDVWIIDQQIFEKASRLPVNTALPRGLTSFMEVVVEGIDLSFILPFSGVKTVGTDHFVDGSRFIYFHHNEHPLAVRFHARGTEHAPEVGRKLRGAIYGQVRASAELQRTSVDVPFQIAAAVDPVRLSASKLVFHNHRNPPGVPPTSRDLNLPAIRENPSTEIEILSHLSTTRPVGLIYGAFFEACTSCCFVGMPLAAGDVLTQLATMRYDRAREHVVTFEQLNFYAVGCLQQIIPAVQHLHNLEIAHLDISLENILYTANGRFYLTDFGHARRIGRGAAQICMTTLFPRGRRFQAPGKPAYYCPELYYPHLIHDHIRRDDVAALTLRTEFVCGYRVDCWQLGIMLYLMTVEIQPCVHERRQENEMGMNTAVCDWLENIHRPWRYDGGFREYMLHRLYNQRIPIKNEFVLQGMQAETLPDEPPAQESEIVSPTLDVIQGLLNVRPNARFTLNDITNSRWFNQFG